MLRVVLDANVYVAAAIAPNGSAARVVAAGVRGEYELVVSRELLEEVRAVLAREKFRRYLTIEQAEQFVSAVDLGAAVHAAHVAEPPAVSRDPKDDYLFAVGRAAGAGVLVSGDKDVLDSASDMPLVLTPRAILDRLAEERERG